MTDQTQTQNEYDPFDSASSPALPTFELFGLVEINAWACALVKGVGKVPFDTNDSSHKRFTAIDVLIQPLPEINLTNPKAAERHWLAESKEWASITLKSIKECGIENVREVNGKWARVAIVPNGKTYTNKNNEVKDETTFKFTAFFEDEESCRAAYLENHDNAGNGQNETIPPIDATAAEKQTAAPFLNVIIPNAVRGKKITDDWKSIVNTALAQYPLVSKHYNADSPEVAAIAMPLLGA